MRLRIRTPQILWLWRGFGPESEAEVRGEQPSDERGELVDVEVRGEQDGGGWC